MQAEPAAGQPEETQPEATQAVAGQPATTEPVASETVQSWHVGRMVLAWVIAAVFGVAVLVLAPAPSRLSWLVLAIGVSSLVTFGLQLGTAQKQGFITRLAFSIAGSVLIIAVIDGIGTALGRL